MLKRTIAAAAEAQVRDADWQALKDYTMLAKNGLPASGRELLRAPAGYKEGDKAWERFNYLMLDSLKKDRETDTKSGLAAASRWREKAGDISLQTDPRPISLTGVTVRVVIVDPCTS